MFPSFFWSTANYNYYIVGSIISPILSESCKDDGFADIPTNVNLRLANDSSSTSSDHHYAIFGHDLMCSIDANNCDMRQHKKGMTSSNTADGGLDLRYKDDSNFLHSIDIHQMVNILCAYQEYFQWDTLIAITCNTRKHFDKKPIREWLDENKQKMHFPNWCTYSFFSASRNKKSFISICFEHISTRLGISQ